MTPFESLVEEVRAEFPDLRIVSKPWWMWILGYAFMHNFTTVVGHTVWTPIGFDRMDDARKCIILRHERVHMRQQARHGGLWFSLLYLFAPLPFVFAWWRMKFEQEAYRESMRAAYEYWGEGSLTEARKRAIMSYFTGPSYLWTWPFRKDIEAWYDGVVAELREGRLSR